MQRFVVLVGEHDPPPLVAENRPLAPSEDETEESSPPSLSLRAYIGEIEGGTQNGYGKMVYHSNAADCAGNQEPSYEGQWSKSKRSGKGTMRYCDGSVFKGEWKDDKPSKGVFQWTTADGTVHEYKGGIKGNKLHGVLLFFYLAQVFCRYRKLKNDFHIRASV
ncbi:unnamed protein product [Amoebophrya sp. A120]|nr:unnamed protein product [Amoebophrya sp. A120]|eukprot:GSA120T00016247001.1